MNILINFLMIACLLTLANGCGFVAETGKTVWGSSTRALENSRDEAISKSYVCPFDGCFDTILSLAQTQFFLEKEEGSPPEAKEVKEPEKHKFFRVFLQDRVQSHIVVIGVQGNVDTTEVGIFFARLDQNAYRIDVSSLSSSAKRKVAEVVFAELDSQYPEYKK
ncbi:MAG TPA: hypothetical protein DD723_08685 [Candidatus Omnitrophica bacterium]|nr:MAG: hypothetical protein A2Z81_07080 [Omnitrophica WOR_2 bacterium GWA2_45_18]OGX19901.1 MAG: hypothetical protein A2Y04_00805 [Omnitrophica WOR_2 bacterium GWC2_45_7]HBR15594.1 hypothetical protein [Candidatus Omnitrophota bacterium]